MREMERFKADRNRVLALLALASLAALAGLGVVVCVATHFNPFAWAWGLVMELARAIGGRG